MNGVERQEAEKEDKTDVLGLKLRYQYQGKFLENLHSVDVCVMANI